MKAFWLLVYLKDQLKNFLHFGVNLKRKYRVVEQILQNRSHLRNLKKCFIMNTLMFVKYLYIQQLRRSVPTLRGRKTFGTRGKGRVCGA